MKTERAIVERIAVLDVFNSTGSDQVSKLVKIWENKNAQRALRGAGLSTMALSLAACGGGSDPVAEAPAPAPAPAPTAIAAALTIGPSDIPTLGDGDDAVSGAQTAAGADTWQITDVIAGGLGSDTLTATIGGNITYTAATAANLAVENLVVTTTGGVRTITLSDATTGNTFAVAGLQSITATTGAGLTVNEIPNLTAIAVVNDSGTNTFAFATAVLAGTADTVTLDLNGATGAVVLGTTGDPNGGYETLVINSTGAASTLTAATDMGATATAVTINASAGFNMAAAGVEFAAANTVTITGSGATSLILADKAAANAVARTVTGGEGNDTIDVSNLTGANVGVLTVSGNGGNDVITPLLDATAVYTGGDGTDTIILTATGTAANLSSFSGFEALRTSADQAMSNFVNNSGILTIRLTDGDADITNIASGALTLQMADDGAGNAGTSSVLRLVDGAADAVTISMTGAVVTASLGVADEESVTIDASTAGITLTNFTTTDMTSLTVTGDNAVNVGTSSGTATATVNVSALDAAFTGDFSASTADMTVTGNSGTNAGAMAVTTGSGNDNITGSNAADTVLAGGNGADTIRGGNGNDGINVGAGNDRVVFEATGAANDTDTITGFGAGTVAAGGDILDFSAFIGAGTVNQGGGAGTALVAYVAASNNDTNITNQVALFEGLLATYDGGGDGNISAADAVAMAVAEIQGGGNAFSVDAGGKAILIVSDTLAGAGQSAFVLYVDDSVGATAGTIEADDITVVADLGATFDIQTLITTNIDVVA